MTMRQFRALLGVSPLLIALAPAVSLAAEVISVYGEHDPRTSITPQPGPDASVFIKSAPGASVRQSATLSSIPQYRGLHTYRLQTHVDGRQPHTAGVQWLDSPLFHLPGALIDSLEVYRGIAPVSAGSSLAGYIAATSISSRFAADATTRSRYRVTTNGHTADDGASYSAFYATGNDTTRFHLFGVRDRGDDYDSAEHTVAGTRYERDYGGFGIGHRTGGHTFHLDYARSDTGEGGSAIVPLSISGNQTDLVRAGYAGTAGVWEVDAQLHLQDTAHLVDNYSIRQAPRAVAFHPVTMMPLVVNGVVQTVELARRSPVEGEAFGGKLHLRRAAAGGTLTLGADFEQSQIVAHVQGRPGTEASLFVEMLDNAERDQYGLFAEWNGAVGTDWQTTLGARLQRTEMDTGSIERVMLGRPQLQAAFTIVQNHFNMQNRDQHDTEVDLAAVFTRPLRPDLELELGFARKTRAPSHLERYLYTPLEASAGLADGNNYIGDPDLKPEVSYQAELGLTYTSGGMVFTPRVFYRRVDDFITGLPLRPEDELSGPRQFLAFAGFDATPMLFTNAEAEFYGADVGFRVPLTDVWSMYGNASYVRGTLRGTHQGQCRVAPLLNPMPTGQFVCPMPGAMIKDDNIERLPPLRGLLAFEYLTGDWGVTLAADWAAKQTQLPRLLYDDPTNPRNNIDSVSGYAVYHIRARYAVPGHDLVVLGGIENVGDREYTPATGAFNRVLGGDLAEGDRVPNPGRNLFIQLVWDADG